MTVLNAKLKRKLGPEGAHLFEHIAGAIQRILPHVVVENWQVADYCPPYSKYGSRRRREVKIAIPIGREEDEWHQSIAATIRRRTVPGIQGVATETFHPRDYDICGDIVSTAASIMQRNIYDAGLSVIEAVEGSFDENIVAMNIRSHLGLSAPMGPLLSSLHKLSEQSYENKALTFGCLIDTSLHADSTSEIFPGQFLAAKKFKALSDGFRTSYHIDGHGRLLGFIDLERFESGPLTGRHFYPDWAERIAKTSLNGGCAVALSRQGDILIFDGGSLRFTYRHGQWQYWNHRHLINLLRDLARAQRVPKQVLGRVIGTIYRAALDVSFRRSGGLFVVLRARKYLHDVVKQGDAINDKRRSPVDKQFDSVISGQKIHLLPRSVIVELSALDGAVVIENSGRIRAYGAVLQPKRTGRSQGVEGSRTKAAIGASKYGLAVKVSSDGDIDVFHKGKPFMRI